MDLRKRVDIKVYEFHNTHCSTIIITVAYIKVDDWGWVRARNMGNKVCIQFFMKTLR
jgi:hypothetical protein